MRATIVLATIGKKANLVSMTPMTEMRKKDQIAKEDIGVPGDAVNDLGDSGVLYANGGT